MATCSKCKAELEDWRKGHYCRGCGAAMVRALRRRDPEKARAAARVQWMKRTPAQRERDRQRNRRKYEEERRKRLEGRQCVICQGAIPLRYIAQRMTCSDECARVKAWRHSQRYRRKRGMLPKGSEEARRRNSERHQKLWADGGPTFKPRQCRTCGKTFAPNAGQQRYCTMECRQLAARARRYGVEAAEIRRILDEQQSCCAICGAERKGWAKATIRKEALVVDHCHKTGKIRGLLCGDCNTALGRFGDDPARFRAALEYLERC